MPDYLRKQYEENPYPNIPIDELITSDTRRLYEHSVTNAFYARDRQIVAPSKMRILDVGCGTGYGSLLLAAANPGASVLGIDWSENSLSIAEERRKHHGMSSVEFIRCSVEDIGSLKSRFDYVSCNDTLYLLPDPVSGLEAMKKGLTARGIIRADLHNARQRQDLYRAQELFDRLGVMSGCSNEKALAFVRNLYGSLNDHVLLKARTWIRRPMRDDTEVLANLLLRGDRGYTLEQAFSIIAEAGLQFVSMVDVLLWNLDALFKKGICEIEQVLDSINSREDYFLIYDLLNYNRRLYDFWCCLPDVPLSLRIECEDTNPTIHLHPLLCIGQARQEIEDNAASWNELVIGKLVPYIGRRATISAHAVTCIYSLLEGSKSVEQLAKHWEQLCPVHPTTLKAVTAVDSYEYVSHLMLQLERQGIVYIISNDQ